MLAGVEELQLRSKRFAETGEKLTRKGLQVRGKVGTGSAGEVQAVTSLFTGRSYALTCTPLALAAQRGMDEQLRAHARCSHEHVLHLHAAWEEEGSLLVLTELAETSLLERMRRQKVMSEVEAGAVIADACKALVYLHGLTPAIHRRELRPQHLLLVGGRWKLGGFGRSRQDEPGQDALAAERADVRALGALMYELLHGRLPSAARAQSSRLELDRNLTEEAVDALSRLLGSLQPSAREVLDLPFFRRQRGVPYTLSASQRQIACEDDGQLAVLNDLLARCEQGEKRHAELLKELHSLDGLAGERARQAALDEQLAEARKQLYAAESQGRELGHSLGQSESSMLALQTDLQRKHEHNQILYAFARELGDAIASIAGRPASSAPAFDPASLKGTLSALLADLARGSPSAAPRQV